MVLDLAEKTAAVSRATSLMYEGLDIGKCHQSDDEKREMHVWLRYTHLSLVQRAKPSMQEPACPAPSVNESVMSTGDANV